MERLQEPIDAAGFLEAILQEDDPEPELLKNALRKVMAGLRSGNQVSSVAEQTYQRLNSLLEKSGCEDIYTFVQLLKVLGLQVSINPIQETESDI
ncbi:MAG: transcriptional regulator [Merismopedia sp. SIO2A8]|nr:transcriptional regulator [Merismopedia sp. SIO2A8]